MSLSTWFEELKKRGVLQNHALILKLGAKGLPVRNSAADGIVLCKNLFLDIITHIYPLRVYVDRL